jgi:hypothetical protein
MNVFAHWFAGWDDIMPVVGGPLGEFRILRRSRRVPVSVQYFTFGNRRTRLVYCATPPRNASRV